MRFKAPNLLSPLSTQRQNQWARQVIRGERDTRKAIKLKAGVPARKDVMRNLIKDKNLSLRSGRPLKTRGNINPMLKGTLKRDPMRSPDPSPGNLMHLGNTKLMYTGYKLKK